MTELVLRKKGGRLEPVDQMSAARAKLERFSMPEPNSGCWLWLGHTCKGYGYVRYEGKQWIASRLSYFAFVGLPGSMDVCHHCDNPVCINPAHLFLGTAKDNMADRGRKGRTFQKLTDQQVKFIRMSPEKGCNLARHFDVSDALISLVRSGYRGAP